jgi:transcription elongation GreA/GreB family factor
VCKCRFRRHSRPRSLYEVTDVQTVDAPAEVVESGSDVVIRVGQEQERWTVVAPHEADALKRRVSEMSPLGFALLGRRPGETVTVRAPAPYRVTIVAVG